MQDSKMTKFENPARLAELDPENTLRTAGFTDGMTLCDIGAGTGIFIVPATSISKNDVFALEISEEMIEILRAKKETLGLDNLQIRKVDSDRLPMADKSCEMAAMITVFHEIKGKTVMLNEIRRILKEGGRFLIVDFHKMSTPMGPPVAHRISQEETEQICRENGFRKIDSSKLGDNFYGIVFEC